MIKLKGKSIGLVISLLVFGVSAGSLFTDFLGSAEVNKLRSKRINVTEKVIHSKWGSGENMALLFVQYNGKEKVIEKKTEDNILELYAAQNGGKIVGHVGQVEIDGLEYYKYFNDLHGIGLEPHEFLNAVKGVENINLVKFFSAMAVLLTIVSVCMSVFFISELSYD